MRSFYVLLAMPLVQAVRRALVVVDMTVEQVANISFQKDEMIQTIRELAQSGQYSCFAGGADLESHLRKLRIEEVVITGINTDRLGLMEGKQLRKENETST
eukprot:Skav235164  [mRNA]  locus=scaffold721:55412:56373:+ [translate_table: standard]